MKDSRNKVDGLIKKAHENGTTPVPDFVWDQIEERIKENDDKIALWWLPILGLFLAVMGLCSLPVNSMVNPNPSSISQNQEYKKRKEHKLGNDKIQLEKRGSNSMDDRASKIQAETLIVVKEREATYGNKKNEKREPNGSLELIKPLSKAKSKGKPTVKSRLLEGKINPKQVQLPIKSSIISVVSEERFNNEKQFPVYFPIAKAISPSLLNSYVLERALPAQFERKELNLKPNDTLVLTPWSVLLSSNYVFFDLSVLNKGFRSGSLSNRTFKSMGLEQILSVNYNLNPKMKIGVHGALNVKNSQFDYAVLANSQNFNQYKNKGTLSIAELETTHQEDCDLYYIESVKMNYSIQSINLGLNIQNLLLQKGKFSLWSRLEVSSNLKSNMRIRSVSGLELPTNTKGNFNEMGLGAFGNLAYQFNPNWNLFLNGGYRGINTFKHEVYTKNPRELVLGLGIQYRITHK